MLLNLSNHPSTLWQAAQKEAAKGYGEISDMPFPKIAPEATATEIQSLAQEYADKIMNLQPKAVHVMGEMTFTFTLVHRLLKANILCIASTTNRTVTEKNGEKVSVFQFVHFRPYTL